MALEGGVESQNSPPNHFFIFFLNKKFFLGGITFFLGTISLGRVVVPSPKIVINLLGPMRSYPDNPIGSAVNEILRYKQTNRQTDTVLLCIIDVHI